MRTTDMIYILTECNADVGMGHLGRCISFYDGFQKSGYIPQLIIDGSNDIKDVVGTRNYELSDWISDISEVDRLKARTIFLDAYSINQQLCDQIRSKCTNFIIIDDHKRLRYENSVIIDWTPNVKNAGRHSNNINNGNVLLLDLEYSIIRPEFISDSEAIIHDNQDSSVTVVTITMGGSDVRNLTKKIAESIDMTKNQINVIWGPYSKKEGLNPAIFQYDSLNAAEMHNLFCDSDIIISAGGQTIFELACMCKPVIPIKVVDNQFEDLEGFKNLAYFDEYYEWYDPNLLTLVNKKLDEYEQMSSMLRVPEKFKVLSKRIGRGMESIIKTISEHIE